MRVQVSDESDSVRPRLLRNNLAFIPCTHGTSVSAPLGRDMFSHVGVGVSIYFILVQSSSSGGSRIGYITRPSSKMDIHPP